MPEQLSKHPAVTLQVLQSAGARCGADAPPPQILGQCPAAQFCALPGGEICVYGFDTAARMTQPTGADWALLRPLAAPSPAPAPASPGPAPVQPVWLGAVLLALAIGLVLGWALARARRQGG